jgi:NAD(P)-dependent dehydrogenase (short-subunit alcohol dehydrogenase family)
VAISLALAVLFDNLTNDLVSSGNPAYNASKAAVKSMTEQLAYELVSTQAKVTAHLFM